jgi:hypothetical protein
MRPDQIVDDEAMGGERFTSVATWACSMCRICASTVRGEDRGQFAFKSGRFQPISSALVRAGRLGGAADNICGRERHQFASLFLSAVSRCNATHRTRVVGRNGDHDADTHSVWIDAVIFVAASKRHFRPISVGIGDGVGESRTTNAIRTDAGSDSAVAPRSEENPGDPGQSTASRTPRRRVPQCTINGREANHRQVWSTANCWTTYARIPRPNLLSAPQVPTVKQFRV